ncbi:MAG: 16S rRNA (guanine(527)-N(7))-methyltransferase RsmG [Pseudohongiellaceae bacterium]
MSAVVKKISDGAHSLGLSFSDDVYIALEKYLELLVKWNNSFNLSGISNPLDMVSRHILDSLAVSPYLQGDMIADIGTGAGLPGIPLAIANPDKKFILVDSNGKKTRFLFQAKLNLNLHNISIENCRIEHYQSKEQIDIVLSRAFASLSDMAEKTQHLLAPNGFMLALKGRFPEQEIEELDDRFTVTKTEKLIIPGEEGERHLVFLEQLY